MNVMKRGSRYWARVTVKGIRHQKTFATLEEAESWVNFAKRHGHIRDDRFSIDEIKNRTPIEKIIKSHSIKTTNKLNEELKKIDNMNGSEFEDYCIETLDLCGLFQFCRFTKTPKTKDFGADFIILTPYDFKISVQCKRKQTHVGIECVQEVMASKVYYKAKKCMVITNNYFTESAVELAEHGKILLIDRDRLIELINQKYNNLRDITNKKQWETFENFFTSEIKSFDNPCNIPRKKKMSSS